MFHSGDGILFLESLIFLNIEIMCLILFHIEENFFHFLAVLYHSVFH